MSERPVMTRASGIALALLFALAGCHDPRTEVVGSVAASGLRIPDDVDAVHVVVSSPKSAVSRWDVRYPLCAPGQSTSSGCYTLPLTMTMIPGSVSPNDQVRVQVDAEHQGHAVISDAVSFQFKIGQSLRLDFVLYGSCLGNLVCAARDQACGSDAQCATLALSPLGAAPDLGIGEQDLAKPADLAGPDLKGCVPSCSGRVCGPDGCGGFCKPGCNLPASCDDPSGQCVPPPDMAQCIPQCGARQCGSDNCGHPNGCGMCTLPNYHCDLPSGQCVPNPPPDGG